MSDYQPGDEDSMVRRESDWSGRVTDNMAAGGLAFTLRLQGRVVAVMGAVNNWPGYATAWAQISDDIRGQGRPLTRATRSVSDVIMKEMALHRMDAYAVADHPEYGRWLKLLGFTHECTLQAALPNGGDLCIYARWSGRSS